MHRVLESVHVIVSCQISDARVGEAHSRCRWIAVAVMAPNVTTHHCKEATSRREKECALDRGTIGVAQPTDGGGCVGGWSPCEKPTL